MVAMEGEERQKARRKKAMGSGISTPKKRRPERPVIGSGSTWTEDQLDLFRVEVKGGVDVKAMIPEKWFDFGSLDNYQSSIASSFLG